MFKLCLPAALITSIVLLAACGGGDRNDNDGERLSKADFIARADAICHDAVVAAQAIPEPSSQGEIDAAFAELDSIFDRMLDDLRGLRPPAEDEAALDEMYGKIDEIVTLSGELLKAEDEDTYRRLDPQITQLEAEVADIAREYGFASCGLEEE